MTFPDFDHQLTAAIVAAAGTIIGALIQLRAAWRRQVAERARSTPPSRKTRRGPVLAVVLLLVAGVVGGFALSQFFVGESVRDSAALQGELKSQIAQIGATANRIEQASLADRGAAPASVGLALESAATATIGPCRAASGTCTEADPWQLRLCASLPASVEAGETLLFTRIEGTAAEWSPVAAVPGQGPGRVRFTDTGAMASPDAARQVCTVFSTWDSEHAVSARLLVKFVPRGRAPITQAALLPQAATADLARAGESAH